MSIPKFMAIWNRVKQIIADEEAEGYVDTIAKYEGWGFVEGTNETKVQFFFSCYSYKVDTTLLKLREIEKDIHIQLESEYVRGRWRLHFIYSAYNVTTELLNWFRQLSPQLADIESDDYGDGSDIQSDV